MALNLKMKAASKKNVVRPESAAIEQATRLRSLLMEMDSLKAQVEEARDELLNIVNEERNQKIRKGEDVTSINAPTSDGNRIMVVYNEKFKVLDHDNVIPLRSAFGEKYPVLVEEIEAITFREGVKMSGIEAAIGVDAMEKLKLLLEVKEGVAPKKGVFKEASRLFREGDIERGEDLLTLLDATTYSPTVRAK